MNCPLCGGTLVAQERVVVERVPATVPEHFDRSRQAPYRTVERYELVRCEGGHTFKRSGSSLYGTAVRAA